MNFILEFIMDIGQGNLRKLHKNVCKDVKTSVLLTVGTFLGCLSWPY